MGKQKCHLLHTEHEKGIALITALLLLVLMSALAVAVVYKVNYEQHLQGTDSGNNVAFYGAEAGMEKMVADLNALYKAQAAPGCNDIAKLYQPTQEPSSSDVGVGYSQYTITLPDGTDLSSCTVPPQRVQAISQGPNAGLQAQVVPLRMSVAAQTPPGESVAMVRQVEVARIPIFQFGVFSESDLSFFPGPDFDFSGRVHTNGNLFLAEGAGQTLWFHNAIRAAKDVVRDQLANGEDANAQGRTGKIMIANGASGCDSKPTSNTTTCLNLAYGSGSSIGGATPTYGGTGTANPNWPTTSTGPTPNYYNSMILSGKTGAQTLEMAFVKTGVDPIEIIRQPRNGEDPSSSLGESRLYNQAQIRVLLADDPAELPGGAGDKQNIRLANVQTMAGAPDYSTGVPVDGSGNRTFFAEGTTASFHDTPTNTDINDLNWVTPTISASNTLLRPGLNTAAADPNAPLIATGGWNLLDGYLRVEYRPAGGGSFIPVTQEWLELGFARGLTPPTAASPNPVNPNAILILQELADRNADGIQNLGQAAQTTTTPLNHTYGSCQSSDTTAVPTGCSLTSTSGSCSGSKHKTWSYTCTNTTPAVKPELADGGTGVITGPATRHNWYPINMYDTREGEFRDVNSGACKVNGILNLVEIDVNNLRKWLKGAIGSKGTDVEYLSQNGYILYFSDRRGMEPNANLTPSVKNGEYGFEDVINQSSAAGTPNNALDSGEDVNANGQIDTWGKVNLGLGFGAGNSGDPTKAISCLATARPNWVSGARHGVRLVDGSQGRVPTRFDNDDGGFTLASENPAYILGDYNASGGFGDPHASTAVIADTVTLLSNNFSDLTMWNHPTAPGSRPASDTWYRVAIATGKNINFLRSAVAGAPPQDFGTDGGVHNFLRFLENWGSKNIYYRGSMASMYYSMYATGVFKCCTAVYGAPSRNYAFDLDFQDLSNMPPGTPTVTDVENLGFQQVF